jgi:hypothetical protein
MAMMVEEDEAMEMEDSGDWADDSAGSEGSNEGSSAPTVPTLNDLLQHQNMISGYWKDTAEPVLSLFFEGDDLNDKDVIDELDFISDATKKQRAYLTLLSLYVLQNKFDDRFIEWELVGGKGEKYLKGLGIKKPKDLIKMFTLELA